MDVAEKLRSRNNGFGPISVKRSNGASLGVALYCFAFIMCISVVRIVMHEGKLDRLLTLDDITVVCGTVSALLTGEFMRRLCLFMEERKHVETRYLGSYLKALEACVCSPKLSKLTLGCYLAASLIFFACTYKSNGSFTTTNYFVVVSSYIVVKHCLPAKSLATVEVSDLSEQDNRNIGSGLACSYYYGYLKLVLPGFEDMISNAVAPTFTLNGKDLRNYLSPKNSRRLYVIVPRNGHCYNDLKDLDPRLEFVAQMPGVKRSRGGVVARPYPQSLYCVRIDGKEPVYAVLEYATPLMTMYKMMKYAGMSVHDLEEQVILFVRTLREILERDVVIRDKIQLVLTGDAQDGFADVIFKAINEDRVELA